MTPHDLCALGAAALPTRDLVRLLVRRPMSDDDVRAAVDALALLGRPREVACQSLRCGPQLLAAIELGRRAWMAPSPAGRRVGGPADVAALMAPRLVDALTDNAWVVALDVRLTVARVERVATDGRFEAGAALRAVLAAGSCRGVLVARRLGPAVPRSWDVDGVRATVEGARLVGVQVLDAVVLGDDGFCSFRRLGVMPDGHASDRRYR